MNEWTKRYYDEAYLRRWPFLGKPDPSIMKNAASILELLAIGDGDKLLEVGCGQGRYSLAFSQMGAKVTGLDASNTLLYESKILAQKMGLGVEWVLGDMREIPFESKFDAVVSMDAFGFFEDDKDNQKTMNEMAKVLKPGAGLLIAVVNGSLIVNNFKEIDREEHEGFTIEIRRTLYPERSAMKEQMHFIDKNGESSYERFQRLYSVEELSELMANAGLDVKDISGKIPFNPNAPEKIVLLAIK